MPLPPYPRGITRHPVVDVPKGLRLDERSVRVPARADARVAELSRGSDLERRAGFETPSGAVASVLRAVQRSTRRRHVQIAKDAVRRQDPLSQDG
ncbi:hypothetical protein [Microbacterium sp. NPDC056234]|uniref:hypothetical protein n=1 Tax=Microbacterium sp. NPDC056234 TaxID=3345757 RepID=UPI0035D5B4D0